MPRTQSPRFDRQPSVSIIDPVLFENDLVPSIAGIKIPHRRIRFLDPLKKMNQRFPLRRQTQNSIERQVDVMIVTQVAVTVHGYA